MKPYFPTVKVLSHLLQPNLISYLLMWKNTTIHMEATMTEMMTSVPDQAVTGTLHQSQNLLMTQAAYRLIVRINKVNKAHMTMLLLMFLQVCKWHLPKVEFLDGEQISRQGKTTHPLRRSGWTRI